MNIINFGSLNIDHVYHVPRFVKPGETFAAEDYFRTPGGKGLNQSIAIARAGAPVFHAGSIGEEGRFLVQMLRKNQVDTQFIRVTDTPTGHASIQVTDSGENAIVIYGGANQTIDERFAEEVLSNFKENDVLILQNEINYLPELIQKAKAKKLTVVFNATPFVPELLNYPLDLVDYLMVNELEAEYLSEVSDDSEKTQTTLLSRFPKAHIIITQGSKGVTYLDQSTKLFVPAFPVHPIDTTAAGDTFIGYFVANYFSKKKDLAESLRAACQAASICVTRSGAAESIPFAHECSATEKAKVGS